VKASSGLHSDRMAGAFLRARAFGDLQAMRDVGAAAPSRERVRSTPGSPQGRTLSSNRDPAHWLVAIEDQAQKE
jgi:hypothetical protein